MKNRMWGGEVWSAATIVKWSQREQNQIYQGRKLVSGIPGRFGDRTAKVDVRPQECSFKLGIGTTHEDSKKLD